MFKNLTSICAYVTEQCSQSRSKLQKIDSCGTQPQNAKTHPKCSDFGFEENKKQKTKAAAENNNINSNVARR